MKCTDLHETLVFRFPISQQRVTRLGSNAQNNAMSDTKILVNSSKPFPIGRLPKIGFSVQVWTSHSIPGKNVFFEN